MIQPVDALASVAMRTLRGRKRTFHAGWGDESLLALNDAATLHPDEIREVDIAWGPETMQGDLVTADGTFASPAPALPPESATGVVRRVAPADGTDAWMVWMASWNDHEWTTRTAFATRAARHGIGSVILMNPYYGLRRPGSRHDQPIATVADFGVMGRAAVLEGIGLLLTLRAQGLPLGIAGYSMGGNIAAMISAASPFPIATAALAVSHSPAPVFLSGPPGDAIAWDALGGRPRAVGAIARIIGSASVLRMAVPEHTDAAVLVGSRRDGFIPATATEALHRHWPGSELRWLRGGHATMLWLAKDELVDAVVRSFVRLASRSRALEP